MSEDERGSLEIESASVQRVRLGLGRWLGRGAAVALLGSVSLAVIELVLKLLGLSWLAFWSSWTNELGGWPYLASLVLGVLSALASSRWVTTSPGAWLSISGEGIRIRRGNRSRLVAREQIADGIVIGSEQDAALELHLRGGDTIAIRVADEEQAHLALSVLGIGADRRRTVVALGGPNGQLAGGCVAFVLTSVALVIALFVLSGQIASFALAISLALLVLLTSTVAIGRSFRPTKVAVGTDGVRIQRSWSARFIPYAMIQDVATTEFHLVLELRSTKRDGHDFDVVHVRSGDRRLLAALADRIRRVMKRGAADGEAEILSRAELLDPMGQPLSAWRASIAALVRGEHGYRSRSLSDEDLLAVLEDPEAPAGRRIGAAMGLRSNGQPASHERIRIAADACASDPLREALARAAADELDEATLEQALAEAQPPAAKRA